jgi:hypothetical protein
MAGMIPTTPRIISRFQPGREDRAALDVSKAVPRFVAVAPTPLSGAPDMLMTIAIILFILWLLGFTVFKVAGGLIHLVLVVAVILFVWNLITGRKAI